MFEVFLIVSIVKPTIRINVSNLFYWSNTLHVSDGLSVNHQEFKTVHTATGICQTGTAYFTYACCGMYSFELLMINGKTVRNM